MEKNSVGTLEVLQKVRGIFQLHVQAIESFGIVYGKKLVVPCAANLVKLCSWSTTSKVSVKLVDFASVFGRKIC